MCLCVFVFVALVATDRSDKPTKEFFVLGNYLGLGNGLLYQKNSCPELFGSVKGIKSVVI